MDVPVVPVTPPAPETPVETLLLVAPPADVEVLVDEVLTFAPVVAVVTLLTLAVDVEVVLAPVLAA